MSFAGTLNKGSRLGFARCTDFQILALTMISQEPCEYDAGGTCIADINVECFVANQGTDGVSYNWSIDAGAIVGSNIENVVTVQASSDVDVVINVTCIAVDNITGLSSEVTFPFNTTHSETPFVIVQPFEIADFNASDFLVNEIQVTFTETTSETYDLWDRHGLIQTNINTGYSFPKIGTETYHVKAILPFASTDSNLNEGTGVPATAVAVTDFNATDTELDHVEITFSDKFGETYDLWDSNGLIASDIDSGYIHYVVGTETYYVQSVTLLPSTADSNTDSGTGLQGPVKVSDFNATDTEEEQITMTWTETLGETYDLWDSQGLVQNGIFSGYVLVITGTEDYYIKSNTTVSVDSNVNQGTGVVALNAITDFAASDGEVDVINVTWTEQANVIYTLYTTGGIALAQGIQSGYVYNTTETSDMYLFIQANSSGTTLDSNTDEGYIAAMPEPITDFNATDDQEDQITMTFTETPRETYDLWDSTGLVQSNISSGYILAVSGHEDYHVQATTNAGTISSNIDQGIGVHELYPITDFNATDGDPTFVTATWTEQDQATYNLHIVGHPTDDIVIGVTSPYVHDMQQDKHPYDFYVEATSLLGDTLDSNIDEGWADLGPQEILDFAATDDETSQITMTFSESHVPGETYDLWDAQGLLEADISDGYVYLVSFGTDNYHIVSNLNGGEISSNIDSGTAIIDPNAKRFEMLVTSPVAPQYDFYSVQVDLIDNGDGTYLYSADGMVTRLASIGHKETTVEILYARDLTNLTGAWADCDSLTSFGTSVLTSVTNAGNAWSNCTGLTSFDARGLTSVTDAGNAWGGCSGLTSFDASPLISVTHLSWAWKNCANLVCITSMTAPTTYVNDAFDSCASLVAPNASEQTQYFTDTGTNWINPNPCP